MRVLVVDDSRAIRRIIGGIMQQLDFEVLEAANGIEALQCLEEYGTPDIALVDWNMPEMDGLDFIKQVRADPTHSDLPMIMVTTETEMERMTTAFVAGVNEYV